MVFHRMEFGAKAANVAEFNEEMFEFSRHLKPSINIVSDVRRFLVPWSGCSEAGRFVTAMFELKIKEVCLCVMCM